MLPVYDPKAFDGIDLRKYHIRDIKDVIKFMQFVVSRMEEAEFVLKKFNTQYATFKTVSGQLRQRVEAELQGNQPAEVKLREEDASVIQKVEDKPADAIHEALIAEIKQAAAEETMLPQEEEDPNERAVAVLGKYKMVNGKRGPMFYRENDKGQYKLVARADVPEDIKQQLTDAIEG